MSTADALYDLKSRIESRFSIQFLTTWEEDRWEALIADLAAKMERKLTVWSVTEGFKSENGESSPGEPAQLLAQIREQSPNQIFYIKDFHPFWNDPRIVRAVRDLANHLTETHKTVLFVSPEIDVPIEILKESIKVDLPLPTIDDLKDELRVVLKEQHALGGIPLKPDADEQDKLLKTVLGLTTKEARKALRRGLLGRNKIDDDVYSLLVSEKKYMVQGSDMLEFQDLGEGVADVGGLEGLKDWMNRRSEAFGPRAREQGIPSPKGVLLLGVQGCGKSLTARAVAKLLSFPLVRLDISSLLSSDQGASEKNMRDVLTLMEMIAPAVLWLDEIEKGFAGSTDEGGGTADSTMVRIMGRFLTWMQENPASVFVVATANSVTGLPPEMLRRGRFDELFFVDLPNYHERIDIYNIHLRKRGWDPENYNVEQLADKSEGYSGAEIEQVVVSAMVEAFSRGGELNDDDLDRARDDTVPLSVTMEEKIFELREWARPRCRPATPDSRVLQMLEQENRERGVAEEAAFDDEPDLSDALEEEEWITIANDGDLPGAVLEFVRSRDDATFAEIIDEFAPHVETDGEQGIALRSDPNIVLWLGMNGDIAGPIAKLISSKKLFLHPSNVDRYEDAADEVSLPTMEELPENRVSRPVWYPCVVSDLEPDDGVDPRFHRVARMMLSK